MESYWFIVIGALIGSIVSNIIFHMKTAYGTLKIDHSNPEKDVYRIEFNKFDDIDKKKYLRLKIDNHADLSQK